MRGDKREPSIQAKFVEKRRAWASKPPTLKTTHWIYMGDARVMEEQGHPAPFPKELAFRLINMFSFVGDIVLDPFWGTGTTTAAAIEAHRSSIGYEIEPRYLEMGRARFRQSHLDARVQFFLSSEHTEVRSPPLHCKSVPDMPTTSDFQTVCARAV